LAKLLDQLTDFRLNFISFYLNRFNLYTPQRVADRNLWHDDDKEKKYGRGYKYAIDYREGIYKIFDVRRNEQWEQVSLIGHMKTK